MRYILVDSMNLFHRASHEAPADIGSKIGWCMHVMFSSIRRVCADYPNSHIVFMLEGRSWRKDIYPPYKAPRKVKQATLTQKELDNQELLFEAFDLFMNYLHEQTNCTVLQHPRLEADDLIAGFIQAHPNSDHVILSTDGDFAQLIADNVMQYNGVSKVLTTLGGFFDDKGRPIVDKKTKAAKPPINPEWALFEKCIRGDRSDNVFSAYPGVRKTKMQVAFDDRNDRGYNWNNFMLQKFMHHDGSERRVLDEYNMNKTLIDLAAQPPDIKQIIQDVISGIEPKSASNIGVRFMQFCGKHELNRISADATTFAKLLSTKYVVEETVDG